MPNQVMCEAQEADAFVRISERVMLFMKSYLSATYLANLLMKEEEEHLTSLQSLHGFVRSVRLVREEV